MPDIPRFFLGFLLLMPLSFPAFSEAAEKKGSERVYVLAVIPSAPPVAIHKAWTPFIERLSKETGIVFKLKIFGEMSEFERELERTPRDFVFLSPTQAVIAGAAQGYIPLVRSSKDVTGSLFVRAGSPIRSVRDLEGKEIAFVGTKNV